jgi:hypothetical protein
MTFHSGGLVSIPGILYGICGELMAVEWAFSKDFGTHFQLPFCQFIQIHRSSCHCCCRGQRCEIKIFNKFFPVMDLAFKSYDTIWSLYVIVGIGPWISFSLM